MSPEEVETIRIRAQYDDHNSWLSGQRAIKDRIALLQHIDELEGRLYMVRRGLDEAIHAASVYEAKNKQLLGSIEKWLEKYGRNLENEEFNLLSYLTEDASELNESALRKLSALQED